MRCRVSRSLPIGCTVVTTASAPATTLAAEVGVVEVADVLRDAGQARGGARAAYDGSHVAPARPAAQVAAPTSPLAPVTTTVGVLVGSHMPSHTARAASPGGGPELSPAALLASDAPTTIA